MVWITTSSHPDQSTRGLDRRPISAQMRGQKPLLACPKVLFRHHIGSLRTLVTQMAEATTETDLYVWSGTVQPGTRMMIHSRDNLIKVLQVLGWVIATTAKLVKRFISCLDHTPFPPDSHAGSLGCINTDT